MLPPRPRLSRYSLLSLSEKRTDLYLADLSPGLYFDPDLEESAGLDAAALAAMVFKPMARSDVCYVQRLVNLGINPAAFCIPTRSIPLAALVASVVRATTALAMVAHTCLGFLVRMGVGRTGAVVGVSGGDSRLALRVALRAL
jgi:hypothetical protein